LTVIRPSLWAWPVRHRAAAIRQRRIPFHRV